MQFTKGMRDKLLNHIDIVSPLEVEMKISGNAVYDFCCFCVDDYGKLSDDTYMIFYNQLKSPNGEIVLEEEREKCKFFIDLKKIPDKIQKLVFTVSIDGNGSMSEIDWHKVVVSQNGNEYITLDLNGRDFCKEKAIISVEIYRRDTWRIAAVANGFNGGIKALLEYFGGEEVSPKEEQSKEKKVTDEAVATSSINEDTIKCAIAYNETHTFNGKDSNSTCTKVSLKYNPYTVESKITVDGQEVQSPNKLYDLRNERIQVWIDQLLPILVELCNENFFEISFYGLQLDYDDVYEIIRDYCEKHSEIEVRLKFEEAKGSDTRLKELQELFEEMQRECPFEELKTQQIQENFNSAISSEFEVSVIATMSSGKSTLINSLLGKELMPSKNEACTATIAKIKDTNIGQNFNAQYRDRENNVLGQYPNLTLDDMEEMNNNPDTAYIDIEGNIPNIDSSGIKLVLVDTPGPNNSRTEEHKNHTYRVIKEKTKPMVLYVLNATQLQTNDDYTLLSTVAEAMKVGGKQSKDRFIFAVNKIDQFDPDKESVQDALQHVREYLKKFDIENPNIFPTSAETAKVIRMYQNGVSLTKGQTKTLANCSDFIKEPQLHLSEQASLSKSNIIKVKNEVSKAKENGDIYEETLWHTGIPAVEMAINEYLKKYAYTTKIKTAVDTFKKKVEEKDMHAKMMASIQHNEASRVEIHQQLIAIKSILDEGKEAEKFKKKIEDLDMMKDAKARIRTVRAKITKELNLSGNKGAMTTLEVQQLMLRLNNTVSNLQSDVKTELDNIISDVIVDNANNIMKEYQEYIHEIIQSGMVQTSRYNTEEFARGVNFLELDIPNAQEIINSYKYDEEYEVGEEWVENTNKKWYKPWTWFEESGHYRTVYANREMVDYSTVENEYLTPIIRSFNENLEAAQNVAQQEAGKFKKFFLQQLEQLKDAMRNKIEENERLTQNQKNIEQLIRQDKEKVRWLEEFLKRLERILEI